MSYAAITPFAHGNTLIDDPLIQLGANLDAVHAVLGDIQRFYPAGAAVVGEDNDQAYFVHLYRWLWVSGDATIEDVAGVEDSVSVSAGDTEPTRFDTRSVAWLTIGKIYRVTGCSYSMETRDP
jgi:hypothetical protein